MLEFDSIPDVAQENVLKYLAGERDVRACRLVCTKWYRYFDRPRIRAKEHFVFQERTTHSVDEINEVMLRYRGSGVNVNFVEVPLDKLQFQDFGDKIRGIRVRFPINMGGSRRAILMNMLTHTRNITYFHFFLSKGPLGHTMQEQWIEQNSYSGIITELHRRNFRFNDLRRFDTTPSLMYPPVLYEIFPRLQSLRSRCMYLHLIVRSGLPIKEDITEIGKVNVFMENLRSSEIERNFLLSFPKLKKLDIVFQFDPDSQQSSFNTCLNFFTHQPELETLRISFDCHLENDYLHALQTSPVPEGRTDGGYDYYTAKRLSFHILRSCTNLRVLHLVLRCMALHFGEADLQEFACLTRSTKIKELTFPRAVLHRAAFRSHFTLLPLETLKLHRLWPSYERTFTTKCWEALSALLRSNKTLRRIKIQTAVSIPGEPFDRRAWDDEVVAPTIDSPENIIHHRLEHLVLDFKWYKPGQGAVRLEYLMSWELPRLSLLKFGKNIDSSELYLIEDAVTKERFIKWIQKMPHLATLCLNIWCLSVEDVLKMCKPLPKLDVLAFSNAEAAHCDEPQVREVFSNLPALWKIWYHGSEYTRNMVVNSSLEPPREASAVVPPNVFQ